MNENTLQALLESQEAEANAKAEWIAAWTEANRPQLLEGELDTDSATLLGEVNYDQATQLNRAVKLLMNEDDQTSLKQLIRQLMDEALAELAETAWSDHRAELHDAMSDEQWHQYQHRNAA